MATLRLKFVTEGRVGIPLAQTGCAGPRFAGRRMDLRTVGKNPVEFRITRWTELNEVPQSI